MKKNIVILTFAIVLGFPVLSHANVNILKAYREVNPDLKPDCMYCHLDKTPKKEDGKHELNAYGQKAKEAIDAKNKQLKEDELKALYLTTFKEIGRHDNSKP